MTPSMYVVIIFFIVTHIVVFNLGIRLSKTSANILLCVSCFVGVVFTGCYMGGLRKYMSEKVVLEQVPSIVINNSPCIIVEDKIIKINKYFDNYIEEGTIIDVIGYPGGNYNYFHIKRLILEYKVGEKNESI